MTAVQWVQHDTGHGNTPTINGAWSTPKSMEDACAEISQLEGQVRLISIMITCCVAEVAQSKNSASLTLMAVDSAHTHLVNHAAPNAVNISSYSSAGNSKESKIICSRSSSRAVVSSSLSSLAGLRACLAGDTGAATVRWMWDDDVGLTSFIPPYKNLARLNPFRWSNWTSLQDAAHDLERYIGTQESQRPVRLVVLPNMMSSFVTKADNATDAWMALRELLDRNDDQIERAWNSLSRENSFMTCAELISDEDQQLIEGLAPSGDSGYFVDPLQPAPRVKVASKNPNKISHFLWLHELLAKITGGLSIGTVRGSDKDQAGTPLFVVAGACPNNFCGMQALLFCQVAAKMDFWWIKPQKTDGNSLEQMTLDLHSTGPFKNTAIRSRAVYAPLAEKFVREAQGEGNLGFGIDDSGRAYIEEIDTTGKRIRMLLYLVWQESWSSLLARKTFIEGKIFYQRCAISEDGWSSISEGRFFSRQYRIESSDLALAPWQDEEEIPALLPPDYAQDMYAMTTRCFD